MPEEINIEKLASVLNTTSQQGKDSFVRMLWKNQSTDTHAQLMPLLNAEARQIIDAIPEDSSQGSAL